jgi:hypothetical protein
MRQCTLTKPNQELVAWIDVKPSDQGRYVEVKDVEGTWFILSVGQTEQSKEWISKRGKDYLNMKKMTDI